MSIKLSVVYLTIRPGGIDLLAESLRTQIPNYELIVVDGYPGRVRRGKAQEYLLERGVNLTHYVEPKPKSFPKTVTNFANAMNTGAMLASSGYVITLHDFSYLPPGSMAQWEVSRQEAPRRCLLSGIGLVRESPEPDKEEDISVWDGEPLSNLLYETEEWVPGEFELFYSGYPMEFLEVINGFDERADKVHMNWTYLSVVEQARIQKYTLKVDRRLRSFMANHRKWPGEQKTWYPASMTEPPRHLARWFTVSPNPFDFSARRLELTERRPTEKVSVATHKGAIGKLLKGRDVKTSDLPFLCLRKNRHLLPAIEELARVAGVPQSLAYLEDLLLLVPSDGAIGPPLRSGKYEPYETSCIKSLVKPGFSVADVGANVGYYTLLCSRLAGPTGSVHAYEPHPHLAEMLKNNLTLNELTAFVHAQAVGNQVGGATLYMNRGNAGDHRTWKTEENRETLPVAMTSLDESLGDTPLDFLKVNVQGAESLVLRGATEIIMAQRNLTLAIEFWPWGLERCGSSQEEFVDLLDYFEFRSYLIEEKEDRLIPMSSLDLLKEVTKGTDRFTNLWCVRERTSRSYTVNYCI